MPERLDDKVVRRLEAPVTGNRITYDEDVKGFGIRITTAGAKAFILNYRLGGQERRITIGSFPDWTVTAAREQAKNLKRKVDVGQDPMGERHKERAAPTVADLAQLYRELHLQRKRPSSRRNDEVIMSRHILPALGKRRLADMRRTEIAALHREISKTAPIAANRCLAVLSKMFSVGIAEEWCIDNPVKKVERNPENKRNKYLSPAAIARLAEALLAHSDRTAANALRLLLLTGARRGETLLAAWDQFDLVAGVWTKPGAHTKTATEHRVPISVPAIALLTEMRAGADPTCPYVFPRGRSVDAKGRAVWAPLTSINRNVWASVCKTAGIEGFRVHDLRHCFASILASSGLSLPIIGALLGHTQPSTTARYSHLLDDPLRAATERVGAVVTAAGRPAADVVPIRRGA